MRESKNVGGLSFPLESYLDRELPRPILSKRWLGLLFQNIWRAGIFFTSCVKVHAVQHDGQTDACEAVDNNRVDARTGLEGQGDK